MDRREKIARLQLIRTSNIGPITFSTLLARYGSGIKAIEALPELVRRSRVKADLASISQIEDEMADAEKNGAQIVVKGEEHYPDLLYGFEDAPGCLTMKGHAVLLEKTAVAMVGSRNASPNAITFCENTARDLGEMGFIIISGLARGIDTAAYAGSLEHGTIAVIAGGIDQIYPRENERLFKNIAETGLIIAEMPFGMQPLARHFPIRNRLIASLSQAVVVVEAGLRSGSLITAREASDRGRDVMAVPGTPLDPRSQGCNSLIRDGATLVQSAADIAEGLNLHQLDQPSNQNWETPAFEQEHTAAEDVMDAREKLLEFLSFEATEVDELIRQCHFSAAIINAAILELELAGEVERHFGNRVSKVFQRQ